MPLASSGEAPRRASHSAAIPAKLRQQNGRARFHNHKAFTGIAFAAQPAVFPLLPSVLKRELAHRKDIPRFTMHCKNSKTYHNKEIETLAERDRRRSTLQNRSRVAEAQSTVWKNLSRLSLAVVQCSVRSHTSKRMQPYQNAPAVLTK